MSALLIDQLDPHYVNTFAWKTGHTPLSTHISVATVILAYLIVVYALKDYVRHRGKPFDLRLVSVAYNAALSVMSAYLLYQHCVVMHRLLSNHSLWSVLCDERAQHLAGAKTLSLYIIYATKYLELSDTVLLCLRGKSTPFIHLYHHAITAFFAYIGLREGTCLAWTMPILNLTVHVFLYAYFALVESGRRVWWKRYLTLMQVIQFWLIMIPTFVALIPKLIYAVSPDLPLAYKVSPPLTQIAHIHQLRSIAHPLLSCLVRLFGCVCVVSIVCCQCHGGWPGVYLGLPLLFVYLYLFQSLYKGKYKAEGASKAQLTDSDAKRVALLKAQ